MSTPDPTRERVEAVAAVLAEHFVMWHELFEMDGPNGEWRCACSFKCGFSDTAIAHVAEHIAAATDAALTTERTLRAEAEAKVTAVEVLAAEWESWAASRSTTRIDAFRDAAEAIRAALRTRPQGEEGSG